MICRELVENHSQICGVDHLENLLLIAFDFGFWELNCHKEKFSIGNVGWSVSCFANFAKAASIELLQTAVSN